MYKIGLDINSQLNLSKGRDWCHSLQYILRFKFCSPTKMSRPLSVPSPNWRASLIFAYPFIRTCSWPYALTTLATPLIWQNSDDISRTVILVCTAWYTIQRKNVESSWIITWLVREHAIWLDVDKEIEYTHLLDDANNEDQMEWEELDDASRRESTQTVVSLSHHFISFLCPRTTPRCCSQQRALFYKYWW